MLTELKNSLDDQEISTADRCARTNLSGKEKILCSTHPRLFLSYIPNKWVKFFNLNISHFNDEIRRSTHIFTATPEESILLFTSLHMYKDITRASTLLFEIVLEVEKRRKKQASTPLLQIFKTPCISVFLGYNNILCPFIIPVHIIFITVWHGFALCLCK